MPEKVRPSQHRVCYLLLLGQRTTTESYTTRTTMISVMMDNVWTSFVVMGAVAFLIATGVSSILRMMDEDDN